MSDQTEETKKPYPQPIYNNQDLIAASRWFGSHFFDKDTMRFFRSRLIDCTYTIPGGTCVFITSEQNVTYHPTYRKEPRRYTVRTFNTLTGSIDTVGEFQEHTTLYKARKAWKAETERINADPAITARVAAWVAQRDAEQAERNRAYEEREAQRTARQQQQEREDRYWIENAGGPVDGRIAKQLLNKEV